MFSVYHTQLKGGGVIVTKRPMAKVAHDGGDGTILMHCPFCGSGALVARSDGTTECESCMTMFTVQVQPQYPMSPQTMNMGPVTPPGMPGNLNDQQQQMGDMEQQDEGMGDEGFPPGEDMPEEDPGEEGGFEDDGEEPGDDSAAEGDKDDSPFPPKKSFRTATGAVLSEERYLRHLAFRHTPDLNATLAVIREEG